MFYYKADIKNLIYHYHEINLCASYHYYQSQYLGTQDRVNSILNTIKKIYLHKQVSRINETFSEKL